MGVVDNFYHNYPAGRELNPYVYPGSWSGILLAPASFLFYAVFLICVVLTEKKSRAISKEILLSSDMALLAYFTLFLMFIKMLAVLNNLMPLLGISTPISYVLIFMRNFPGDEGLHYHVFLSAMFLLLAPLGLRIVRHLYRPAPALRDS